MNPETKFLSPARNAMFGGLFDEFEGMWERPWILGLPHRRWMSPTLPAWTPRMDVFRKNGELIFKTDLPGMKKENIEVFVEDGDLVFKGERYEEKEIKKDEYFRAERSFGDFYRRLPLPETAVAENIVAKFTDGVLEVKVPMSKVEKKLVAKKVTIL